MCFPRRTAIVSSHKRKARPGFDIPLRKRPRVSLWLATHCSSASALQTRLLAAAVSWLGLSRGYTDMISCNRLVMTPKECQMTKASSGTCSLFLLSSIKAPSLLAGSISSATHCKTFRFSSLIPCSIPGLPFSPPPFMIAVMLLEGDSLKLAERLLVALWLWLTAIRL